MQSPKIFLKLTPNCKIFGIIYTEAKENNKDCSCFLQQKVRVDMNDIKTIEKAMQQLRDMYDCNHEAMDADDSGDLLTTIDELAQLRINLMHDNYIKEVTDFRDHVVSTMPESYEEETDADLKAWEDFYGLKWTISFAGKELTLVNEAGTYQPIVDMLNNYLDNYL